MLRRAIVFFLFASLATVSPCPVWAENEGLADLDRAVETKIRAEKQRDLTTTIELCESAFKKGLDKSNTRFAENLLASALCERASMASDAALTKGPDDPLWRNYRRLALDDLEKAVEAIPNLPDALLLIARLNLLPDGDRDRAVGAVDAALAIENMDPQARSRFLLLRAGLMEDNKKRLELLNEAVSLSPGKIEPLQERGATLASLGKPKEAAADFAEVIKLDPANAVAYEEQARVLAALRQYDKALVSVDKATQLNPASVMSLTIRAEIHAEMGNFDAALHDLNQALLVRPGNPYVLLLRANLYKEMDKPDAALADIDRALRRRPDLKDARRLRWAVLIGQKKYDQVVAEMDEQLQIAPDDPSLLLLRASLYKEMKKPEAALADIDRALRREPDLEDARRLRWSVLIGERKLDQVIAEMEEQLKKTPDNKEMRTQLAMICTAEHQPQKAIEIYSSILTAEPDNLDALQGRANALLGSGKHAEAIADFNKAMKLQDDDSGTLNNLAWVLATSPEDTLRDGRRAIELAQKACELTKYGQAHIISTLAAAYAETGDFDAAVKWSKKAIAAAQDVEPSVRQSLEKELESYRQHKPWRERLQEGLEAAGEP